MKKNIKWLILSFIVLFLPPLLSVKAAGQNGMVLCVIMFFVINPIFFVAEGIICGDSIKKRWYMPIASALIYLLSVWVVFEMGETAFILYAFIYMIIGIFSMLIKYAIFQKSVRN